MGWAMGGQPCFFS